MPNENTQSADERRPLLEGGQARQGNGTISEAQPAKPAAQEWEGYSTAQLSLIMGSVWFGVFFSAVDSTMMAALTGTVSKDLHALSSFAWIGSAHLIAIAGSQPLTGRLTDIFGRRAGMVTANVIFLIGKLICGIAPNTQVFILGRVLCGIGGGSVTSISNYIANDLLPTRSRGLWQGIGNIFVGIGTGLGGPYGGWLADLKGWRFAFLVNVAPTILATILCAITVKIPPIKSKSGKVGLKRVDFLGAFTLVLALVLMLVGLNSGGRIVPWSHPLVSVTIVLGALFLGVFVYVEQRVEEPMIPVRLLLNRTVACACLSNWLIMMSMFGLFFSSPVYFQVLGFTTAQAGARLAPQGIGIGIGSLITGIYIKKSGGYLRIQYVNTFLFVVAMGLICTMESYLQMSWPPFIYICLAGIAWGGFVNCNMIALITAVGAADQAVITAASFAFRAVGSAMGVTVSSAVMQNILGSQLQQHLHVKDKQRTIEIIKESFNAIARLPEAVRKVALACYLTALQGVWWTLFGLAVAAAIVSFGIRENKLSAKVARPVVEEPEETRTAITVGTGEEA